MASANSRGAALSHMMALNNRGVDLFTTGHDVQGAIDCFRGALQMIERYLFTSVPLKVEDGDRAEYGSNDEKDPYSSSKAARVVANKADTSSTNDFKSIPIGVTKRNTMTATTDNLHPSCGQDTRSQIATTLSSRLQASTLHISSRLVRFSPSASARKGHRQEELRRTCLAALTTSFNLALTYQMISYLTPIEKSKKLRHLALGFYEMTISIRARIGDRFGDGVRRLLAVVETSLLNNVAVLHHELGDYERCRCYFKRLYLKLQQMQQVADPKQSIVTTMPFLGNLVLMLGSKEVWELSPAAAA